MPKAKRGKEISLTKTRSKKMTIKEKIMKKITDLDSRYNNILVLKLRNLNNEIQTNLRTQILGDFLFGKKRVMQKYFEMNSEKNKLYVKFNEMFKQQKSEVDKYCLLFTNENLTKIKNSLKNVNGYVYAQPGTVPNVNVKFEKGTEVLKNLATSNAEHLRNLGVFVTVEKGKLNLEEDFLACQKGVPLSVNQCKLLKMLGVKVGKFSCTVEMILSKKNNTVKQITN